VTGVLLDDRYYTIPQRPSTKLPAGKGTARAALTL
jgi:hypothetical protein